MKEARLRVFSGAPGCGTEIEEFNAAEPDAIESQHVDKPQTDALLEFLGTINPIDVYGILRNDYSVAVYYLKRG